MFILENTFEYTKNEKPRCIFSNLAHRASCQSHCCVFWHSFKLRHYGLFIEGWLKTLVWICWTNMSKCSFKHHSMIVLLYLCYICTCTYTHLLIEYIKFWYFYIVCRNLLCKTPFFCNKLFPLYTTLVSVSQVVYCIIMCFVFPGESGCALKL